MKKDVLKELTVWISKNYRRSSQPLYAYVDLKELLSEIKKIKGDIKGKRAKKKTKV